MFRFVTGRVSASSVLNFAEQGIIMKYPLTEARALLRETDPIVVPLAPKGAGGGFDGKIRRDGIAFDRQELTHILNVYGRKVASGQLRDYALDTLYSETALSV